MPTRTYDNTSGEFKYSGSWYLPGTWASPGQQGTLSSTNVLGASVTFTFPVAASGFRFYGMKRSGGGLYGICVDCDPNNPSYTNVDAFDASDNGANPPSVLYSRSWSSASVHTIVIRNQLDVRGKAGNSQLTLDRFELDIPAPAPPPAPPVPPPVTTKKVTTVVSTTVITQAPPKATVPDSGGGAASPSPTTVDITTQKPATTDDKTPTTLPSLPTVASSKDIASTASGFSTGIAQSQTDLAAPVSSATSGNATLSPSVDTPVPSELPGKKSTPMGGIIGGVVGGLAIIAMLILLIFWARRRKQRGSPTGVSPIIAPERQSNISDLATDGTTASPSPRGGWVTGYGFGNNEKGGRHRVDNSQSSNPSDALDSTNPSSTGLLSASPPPPPASSSSYSRSPSYSHPHSQSQSQAGMSSSNFNLADNRRTRELDAGPAPQPFRYDYDNETLPPEYGQLFSDRMSGRVSQNGHQPPRSPPPPLPTPLIPDSPPPSGAFSSAATGGSLTTAATTTFPFSPNRSSAPFQPVRRA